MSPTDREFHWVLWGFSRWTIGMAAVGGYYSLIGDAQPEPVKQVGPKVIISRMPSTTLEEGSFYAVHEMSLDDAADWIASQGGFRPGGLGNPNTPGGLWTVGEWNGSTFRVVGSSENWRTIGFTPGQDLDASPVIDRVGAKIPVPAMPVNTD